MMLDRSSKLRSAVLLSSLQRLCWHGLTLSVENTTRPSPLLRNFSLKRSMSAKDTD